MNQDYEVLDADSLRPGQLCTVLRGQRTTKRRQGGELAMMLQGKAREYYSFWKGFPLRVLHNERRLPYAVFEVLKGDPTDMQLPPRIMLDKRLVQFIGISEEYKRQFLGQQYQTTL